MSCCLANHLIKALIMYLSPKSFMHLSQKLKEIQNTYKRLVDIMLMYGKIKSYILIYETTTLFVFLSCTNRKLHFMFQREDCCLLNQLSLKLITKAYIYWHCNNLSNKSVKSVLKMICLPGVAVCIMATAFPPGAEQRSRTLSPSLTCKARTGSREAAFSR